VLELGAGGGIKEELSLLGSERGGVLWSYPGVDQ
jgi:hypothetical protein